MAEGGLKRKRDVDYPRITYVAGDRTFDRLFKEETLEEVKEVVRRKLGLHTSIPLSLAQLRKGTSVDLEDEDDFDAFTASAHANEVASIRVTIGGGNPNLSFPNFPETPSGNRMKKKKQRKLAEAIAMAEQTPSNVASLSAGVGPSSSSLKTPERRKRAVTFDESTFRLISDKKGKQKEAGEAAQSIPDSESLPEVPFTKEKKKKKKKKDSEVSTPEAAEPLDSSSTATKPAKSLTGPSKLGSAEPEKSSKDKEEPPKTPKKRKASEVKEPSNQGATLPQTVVEEPSRPSKKSKTTHSPDSPDPLPAVEKLKTSKPKSSVGKPTLEGSVEKSDSILPVEGNKEKKEKKKKKKDKLQQEEQVKEVENDEAENDAEKEEKEKESDARGVKAKEKKKKSKEKAKDKDKEQEATQAGPSRKDRKKSSKDASKGTEKVDAVKAAEESDKSATTKEQQKPKSAEFIEDDDSGASPAQPNTKAFSSTAKAAKSAPVKETVKTTPSTSDSASTSTVTLPTQSAKPLSTKVKAPAASTHPVTEPPQQQNRSHSESAVTSAKKTKKGKDTAPQPAHSEDDDTPVQVDLKGLKAATQAAVEAVLARAKSKRPSISVSDSLPKESAATSATLPLTSSESATPPLPLPTLATKSPELTITPGKPSRKAASDESSESSSDESEKEKPLPPKETQSVVPTPAPAPAPTSVPVPPTSQPAAAAPTPKPAPTITEPQSATISKSKSTKKLAEKPPPPPPSCPVCHNSPHHARSRCPVVKAGIRSMRKRIQELKDMGADDDNDEHPLEEREAIITELNTIIEKKTKKPKAATVDKKADAAAAPQTAEVVAAALASIGQSGGGKEDIVAPIVQHETIKEKPKGRRKSGKLLDETPATESGTIPEARDEPVESVIPTRTTRKTAAAAAEASTKPPSKAPTKPATKLATAIAADKSAPTTTSTKQTSSQRVSKPPALEKRNSISVTDLVQAGAGRETNPFDISSPFLQFGDLSLYAEKDLEELIRGPKMTLEDVPSESDIGEEKEGSEELLQDDEIGEGEGKKGKKQKDRLHYSPSSDEGEDEDEEAEGAERDVGSDDDDEGEGKQKTPMMDVDDDEGSSSSSSDSSNDSDSSSDKFGDEEDKKVELTVNGVEKVQAVAVEEEASSMEVDKSPPMMEAEPREEETGTLANVSFGDLNANSSVEPDTSAAAKAAQDVLDADLVILDNQSSLKSLLGPESSGDESDTLVAQAPETQTQTLETTTQPSIVHPVIEPKPMEPDPIEHTEQPSKRPTATQVDPIASDEEPSAPMQSTPKAEVVLRTRSQRGKPSALSQEVVPLSNTQTPRTRRASQTSMTTKKMSRLSELPIPPNPVAAGVRVIKGSPAMKGGFQVTGLQREEEEEEEEESVGLKTRSAAAKTSAPEPVAKAPQAKVVMEEEEEEEEEEEVNLPKDVRGTRSLRASPQAVATKTASKVTAKTPVKAAAKSSKQAAKPVSKASAKTPVKPTTRLTRTRAKVVPTSPEPEEAAVEEGSVPQAGDVSLATWEALPPVQSTQDDTDPGGMIDELASNAGGASSQPNGFSEPLFLPSQTQTQRFMPSSQSYDLQQQNSAVNATSRSNDSDDANEVEAAVINKPPTQSQRTGGLFRSLTDIASQGIYAVAPILRPAIFQGPDVSKVANLYGRTEEADGSDDSGPDSDSDAEANRSHIPKGKRAGLL